MITSVPGVPQPFSWREFRFENVKWTAELCKGKSGTVMGFLYERGWAVPDHPVAGAEIILSIDGQEVARTNTDNDGSFVMYYPSKDLALGQHTGVLRCIEHDAKFSFQFVVKRCAGDEEGIQPPSEWLDKMSKYIWPIVALIGVVAVVKILKYR